MTKDQIIAHNKREVNAKIQRVVDDARARGYRACRSQIDPCAIVDMLADIRHACGAAGLDFTALVEQSRIHVVSEQLAVDLGCEVL